MKEVKVYQGNYDRTHFYATMGKFFAEKIYRKKLPYLINEKNKVWYLFYNQGELAGFASVQPKETYVMISDFYVIEKYNTISFVESMTFYLFDTYKRENIKLLTKSKLEKKLWLEQGFELVGEKGSYYKLEWSKRTCPV